MQLIRTSLIFFASLVVAQVQAETHYDLKLNPENSTTLKTKIELDVTDSEGEKGEMRIEQTEKLAVNKEITGFTSTVHHTKSTVKSPEETYDEKPAEYRFDYVNHFLTFVREAVPGLSEDDEEVTGSYNAIWFQATFYVIPPEKPVKVGDSWSKDSRTWIWLPYDGEGKKMFELDAESVTEMMRGNEAILASMTYTLTLMEKIGERDTAKIKLVGKISEEGLTTTAKGDLWLDVKSGMVIKRDLEIKQTGYFDLDWDFRSVEVTK
jgi:hypothetical protein